MLKSFSPRIVEVDVRCARLFDGQAYGRGAVVKEWCIAATLFLCCAIIQNALIWR